MNATIALPNNTALIIIDQQQGLDHPKLGARNNPNAEQLMLQLLSHWRQAHRPIVHVKHRSIEPDSVFWPAQPGFEFKPDFVPEPGELIIEKSIPCAMTQSGLAQILRHQNIGWVVIVGAATNNSVEATTRTAAGLGFKVVVVEDACFTFAKADYFGNVKTAHEVHAMSLANLQHEYAQITDAQSLL